jgi:hypothetical protein
MSHPSDPRTTSLRFALLACLGLPPIACGGTTIETGGDEPSAVKVTCSSPQLDPVTALVTCSEGYVHRPVAVSCDDANAEAAPSAGGGSGVDQRSLPRVTDQVRCDTQPSVCDSFQYGYCSSGQAGSLCASGCASDADCGPQAICVCGKAGSWGVCELSTCRSDADCQSGLRCASYSAGCGGGYACQTAADTCVAESDCFDGRTCQPGVDGQRSCSPASICGRPFLVEKLPRLAPIVARRDWLLAPLT